VWPDEFVKNCPKFSQNIFWQNQCTTFFVQKVAELFLLLQLFSRKNYRSKQSPNCRKFAQSGHPGTYVRSFLSANMSCLFALTWERDEKDERLSARDKTTFELKGYIQGDQIGRFFSQWVIIYSGQFYKKISHIYFFFSGTSIHVIIQSASHLFMYWHTRSLIKNKNLNMKQFHYYSS
jgi:hypothetical protein